MLSGVQRRLGLSGLAAALWAACGTGIAVGDGPSAPGTGSVECHGAECVVTATGTGKPETGGTSVPVRSQNGEGAAPSTGDGTGWSELSYLKRLYDAGMTAQDIALLNGRAPLGLDPVTGQPLRWLATSGDAGGGAPAAGPALVSPAQLAQVAVSRLRLPSPVLGTSPSGDQVVRVPTWLWVDRSVWGPVSATAQVPGVSVTATAVPVSVTWSMGTGDSVTCQGPGTPYTPGASDAAASSPDCGYMYARSSAGQPRERFAVSVTVSWRVSWAGGGQSGTVEGLSTRARVDLRVREVQAVIVNPTP